MPSSRVAFTTHTLAFVAGFVACKAWDYDELNSYRGQHEGTVTKIKRWAGNISIGVVFLGAMSLVFRATSSSSPTKTIKN